MTTIELYTRDQEIFATSSPIVASGNKNSVKLKVSFDPEWNNYTKTAVFYKGSNPVAWEELLINGECNIPSEVTAELGYILIGVRGITSHSKVKTSALIKYNISKGAKGNYVYEPTDDIYKQILTAYDLEKARLDNLLGSLEEGSTTSDAELIDMRVGADGTIYDSAGEAVREQFTAKANAADVVSLENYAVNGGQFKFTEPEKTDKAYTFVNKDYETAVELDSEYGSDLSPLIDVSNAKNVILSAFAISDGYIISYVLFDEDKNQIHIGCPLNDNVDVNTETKFLQNYHINLPENAKYMRVVFFDNVLITWEHPFVKFDSLGVRGDKAPRPYRGTEIFDIAINKHYVGDNSKTVNIQDGETPYTDKGVLWLPANYDKDGEPLRLVISCHGSGTTVTEDRLVTDRSWDAFLIRMGYAVLDVNGGIEDGRHFGAPWAIDSYIKAYNYVVNKYNLHKEVFVLGCSMGGLTSFGIVQSGRIPVLAQAGFCPVTDLFRQAWMNPWYSEEGDYSVQRKRIAEYYNFDNYDTFDSWTTSQTPCETEMQYFLDNIDKVAGFNPIANKTINYKTANIYNTSTVKSEWIDNYNDLLKIHNVPLKIWHAIPDLTVDESYSKAIVKAINNGGGMAYIREYETGEHTPGWGVKDTVVNYDGKEITAYSNEIECFYWFKRFE